MFTTEILLQPASLQPNVASNSEQNCNQIQLIKEYSVKDKEISKLRYWDRNKKEQMISSNSFHKHIKILQCNT